MPSQPSPSTPSQPVEVVGPRPWEDRPLGRLLKKVGGFLMGGIDWDRYEVVPAHLTDGALVLVPKSPSPLTEEPVRRVRRAP